MGWAEPAAARLDSTGAALLPAHAMACAAAFEVTLLRRPGFEVARLDAAAAAACFPRHTHDDYVLSANLVGAEWIWLDGREHEAGPGQVTAYNPGALQASCGLGAPGAAWSFISLYVEPGFATEALGLPAPPTLGRAVIADPGVAAPLLGLARLIGAGRVAPGLLDEAAVAALSALAGGSHATPRARPADPAMDRIAALLLDHLADPPDLATLAREAGLSREHLVRRFAVRFGLPPMAWALQRRLARARTLLRSGTAPAEAAAALGFADQAHLTRAFRAASGMTPGRYRRAG